MKKIENSSQDLLYYGDVIIDIDPETLDEVHLYNEVIEINNQELVNNPGSIKEEVYKKNIVIVRNAIPEQVAQELVDEVYDIGQNTPTTFYPIQNRCPNFHSINDEIKLAKITMRVHGYHFFGWNEKTESFYKKIDGVLKAFLHFTERDLEFLNNTTEDDYIFRLQVHHYPLGGGHSSAHIDPPSLVKVTPILLLSEKGKDYMTGGVNFINQRREWVDVESELGLKQGDLVVFYPGLAHRVSPIDSNKDRGWDSRLGRWVLLFNILPTMKNN